MKLTRLFLPQKCGALILAITLYLCKFQMYGFVMKASYGSNDKADERPFVWLIGKFGV